MGLFPFLRGFFGDKHTEKRQARGKKLLVCGAVVRTLLCAFASACAAKGINIAFFASFGHGYAFLNKLDCRFAVRHRAKIRFVNVAEQVFIGAVKVARIYIAVTFRNELVRTMPHNAALLSLLPQKQPYPVVKLPHADILPTHIIFDIQIKYAN